MGWRVCRANPDLTKIPGGEPRQRVRNHDSRFLQPTRATRRAEHTVGSRFAAARSAPVDAAEVAIVSTVDAAIGAVSAGTAIGSAATGGGFAPLHTILSIGALLPVIAGAILWSDADVPRAITVNSGTAPAGEHRVPRPSTADARAPRCRLRASAVGRTVVRLTVAFAPPPRPARPPGDLGTPLGDLGAPP